MLTYYIYNTQIKASAIELSMCWLPPLLVSPVVYRLGNFGPFSNKILQVMGIHMCFLINVWGYGAVVSIVALQQQGPGFLCGICNVLRVSA